MIIQDSSVHLSSQRLAVEEYSRKETLRYWEADPSEQQSANAGRQREKDMINMAIRDSYVKVSLSTESIQLSAANRVESIEEEMVPDLNIRVLRALIERFTGRKIKIFKYDHPQSHPVLNPSSAGKTGAGDGRESVGFGLEYNLRESYYEAEETSFKAAGKILTADGVEVDFSLDLNMSREFYQENNISLKMGEALKDPLVVNFEGNAAQLTSTKFSFDIDSDGNNDSISFVSEDSGFLVFDKNNDGIINNGSELFGAMTGNGFLELSQFDGDNNDWIDENDDIYDKLQVWTKDDNGQDHLFALGQKGVGAIYLGSISTSFELNDSQNDKLGQVRSTGIFLADDYGVGTVQQLDLTV